MRGLVGDLISDAVEATVPDTVRETVQAVPPANEEGVSLTRIAETLGIDKSAASRRWQTARDKGYLRNLETTRGKPARIVRGDPLPDDIEILPAPQALSDRCSVDAQPGGIPPPPPPDSAAPATPPTDTKAANAQRLAEPRTQQHPDPCPHPAHRKTDWASENGRVVCGTCHPKPQQDGTA